MLVDLSTTGPVVKLAVALLDDDHGITDDAFTAFLAVIHGAEESPKVLDEILERVKGCEGRVYLRDGWND